MPKAVESVAVGDSEGQSQSQLQSERAPSGVGLLSAASGRTTLAEKQKKSAKWVLKIIQRAMVKRRSYESIRQSKSVSVSPRVPLSLTPQ